MSWFQSTLQAYPELAIFLSLGIGYWVGGKTFKGFSLGAVTSTLIAALIIGQLNIVISADVKNIFFLMFLFAVGYGIGPQFVQGIAKDGVPQAVFAVVQCCFSLLFVVMIAKLFGYDIGTMLGFYAGSQTISAAIGLGTDAIGRLGISVEQTKVLLDYIPVAYAVTYIFGTVGTALVLSELGPLLLRINLPQACKDYEQKLKSKNKGDVNSTASWHNYELRTYQVVEGSEYISMSIGHVERLLVASRIFIEGLKRNGTIMDFDGTVIIQGGDILALGGDHAAVVHITGSPNTVLEVQDDDLLRQPQEGVDVYVTKKAINGKTLEDLAGMADAHGIFLLDIKRGATSVSIPVLAKTTLHYGDILTITGVTRDVERAIKKLGIPERKSTTADIAMVGFAIFLGSIVGSLVFHAGSVPITLSTAGGALVAGLFFGWLRSIHPTFGRIPDSTVWFMNSVGLTVFIAVVGLTAGPSFVAGLKEFGVSLFFAGILATSLPLICGMFVGKYIFKLDPAIVLGCCAGSRTSTAALGMICEKAGGSKIPGLGYTVTYAVGNTILTIWGMVIVMIAM